MKKSRTAGPSRVVESSTVRSLPLVEVLVDTTAALFELMVQSGLQVLAALLEGVVARIVTGPHDANRQDSHLPMRYDTGRPRAIIRFRISQPRTTSLPCPAGLRARRPSPMMDLYRKNAFSTRP